MDGEQGAGDAGEGNTLRVVLGPDALGYPAGGHRKGSSKPQGGDEGPVAHECACEDNGGAAQEVGSFAKATIRRISHEEGASLELTLEVEAGRDDVLDLGAIVDEVNNAWQKLRTT